MKEEKERAISCLIEGIKELETTKRRFSIALTTKERCDR